MAIKGRIKLDHRGNEIWVHAPTGGPPKKFRDPQQAVEYIRRLVRQGHNVLRNEFMTVFNAATGITPGGIYRSSRKK